MQISKAAELRQAWGEKLCTHPELDKEYYLGADTGDYVCTTCGKTFTKQEADELRKQKTKE